MYAVYCNAIVWMPRHELRRLPHGYRSGNYDPNFKCESLTHLPPDEVATILADDNFKCIFVNENGRITIWILLKYVPRILRNNKLALVLVMAWRRIGD